MYHSIATSSSDPLAVTVPPAMLVAQLRWLARRGLRGVSVSQLLRAQQNGTAAGLVGLSFDDGYADFATTAVPILADFEFTATVYVLAGRIGGENTWDHPNQPKPLMDAEQIREVAAAGMEVGSHGVEHHSLPSLSDAELLADLTRSRTMLGELIGRHITGFAYPYGHARSREITAAAAAGYSHAVSVNGTSHPDLAASAYAVARTHIGEHDVGIRLVAKRLRHVLSSRH
jgi:peptidoglycan/xylan/chitin deacetylase (PgdA/CDA1 family)